MALFEGNADAVEEALFGSTEATLNLASIVGIAIPFEERRLEAIFGSDYKGQLITRGIEVGTGLAMAATGNYIDNEHLHTAGTHALGFSIVHLFDTLGEFLWDRYAPPTWKKKVETTEAAALVKLRPESIAEGKVILPEKTEKPTAKPYRPGGLFSSVASGKPFVTPVSKKVVMPLP